MAAYQEPPMSRRRQQQEMVPRYLINLLGLISQQKSSVAWMLYQNLQMFNGCKGTTG